MFFQRMCRNCSIYFRSNKNGRRLFALFGKRHKAVMTGSVVVHNLKGLPLRGMSRDSKGAINCAMKCPQTSKFKKIGNKEHSQNLSQVTDHLILVQLVTQTRTNMSSVQLKYFLKFQRFSEISKMLSRRFKFVNPISNQSK